MARTPTIVALVFAVCGLFGAKWFEAEAVAFRGDWPVAEDFRIVPDPKVAPLMAAWMGRELAADINWVRALVYYGTSDSDYRYLARFIDNIIAVDPHFRRAYSWGASAVVFQRTRPVPEDFIASLKYLELGAERYPDDYEFPYTLGIRYWNDVPAKTRKERREFRERAAHYIERAMRKPNAPDDLGAFAASLRTQLGQRDIALAELREMLASTDAPKARKKLIDRYQGLLGDAGAAAEVDREQRALFERWKLEAPYLSFDMFLILGEHASPRADLDIVAPVRDLFGSESPSEH